MYRYRVVTTLVCSSLIPELLQANQADKSGHGTKRRIGERDAAMSVQAGDKQAAESVSLVREVRAALCPGQCPSECRQTF